MSSDLYKTVDFIVTVMVYWLQANFLAGVILVLVVMFLERDQGD